MAVAGAFLSLPLWAQLVLLVLAVLGGLLARHIYTGLTSPMNDLPGGPAAHWLMGDFTNFFEHPTGHCHAEIESKYGHTARFAQGFGLPPALLTSDLVSIAYIQRYPDVFIKPPDQADILKRFIGRGLLIVEGDTHRRQRRIVTPAFAPGNIRDLLPILLSKSYQLRDRLADMIEDDAKGEASETPTAAADSVAGARKIDIAKFLTLTAFDIIGLAAADYDFRCLETANPIVQLFRSALSAVTDIDLMGLLQVLLPVFYHIPTKRTRLVDSGHQRLTEVGAELIARKKQEVLSTLAESEIEKTTDMGKDLLSVIIKSNMAKDLPESQRMSDEEIIDQVATFLLAGSETSSNGTAWGLWRLAQDQPLQERLRQELFTLGPDPTLDELNALPLLENVVRETLRLDPPVPDAVRETTADCVLPLATPIKDRHGNMVDRVPLPKGTQILIPFTNVHRDPAIWGDDAKDFNPDRYDREGYPYANVPSVYGNLLSFNGGPRNCIGYRFGLAEMKAMLFALLRAFNFELLPSSPEITRKNYITMLPYVVGEESVGSQMPLLVRPLD